MSHIIKLFQKRSQIIQNQLLFAQQKHKKYNNVTKNFVYNNFSQRIELIEKEISQYQNNKNNKNNKQLYKIVNV